MKMNRDGKIARFYRWSYGEIKDEMPNNMCAYFWKVVIAMVFFPITWLSYPWGFTSSMNGSGGFLGNYEKRFNLIYKRLFTGIFLYMMLSFVAFLTANLLTVDFDIIKIILCIARVVGIILTVIMLTLITVYIKKIYNRIMKSEFIIESKSMISDTKNGFMDNYCPKINWKNSQEEEN